MVYKTLQNLSQNFLSIHWSPEIDSIAASMVVAMDMDRNLPPDGNLEKIPLDFMRSKLVLLFSHELSFSGGPLLLMELAFLLRNVGGRVIWITYKRPAEENEVIHTLDHKMMNRGLQALSAKSQEAIDTALKDDMIILNIAITSKWLDVVLKKHLSQVISKILWWIHEMRGHYFKLDYVKHLPFVAAAMIDSYIAAE
ncbi:hypothetical protein MA16_Dca009595 [Dendrobium catenatum]|uniref:Uncharacterized protein n=1 Tax=Dendrobium catenatum TaxID=906689 RepID=A0A2I0VS39_9ASPA|nr:hypothetical protein MA16_Dca009595 [Dendrobium catenatum]